MKRKKRITLYINRRINGCVVLCSYHKINLLPLCELYMRNIVIR